MSTSDANDRDTTGYFLPEESQLRLKKLHEYVTFLANLARPRQTDEDAEWYAEIRPGEVAICLEQLEEQIAQVMAALSWPAERGAEDTASEADSDTAADVEGDEGDDASRTDAEAASMPSSPSGEPYTSGVTLEQIDQINLLLESLRALGNVVYCADHAEYSKATLTIMGDAIYRDVDKIHDILDAIYESQRFGPKYELNSVREERASYLALPARSPGGGSSYLSQPHPTYQ